MNALFYGDIPLGGGGSWHALGAVVEDSVRAVGVSVRRPYKPDKWGLVRMELAGITDNLLQMLLQQTRV